MQINIDKKSGVFLGVIAGLLLVIVGLLVFRDGDHDGMMDDSHSGMMHSSNSTSLNSSDIMFLQMMIPHHQQAVDISNLAISKSRNQELVTLAKTILTAQTAEISPPWSTTDSPRPATKRWGCSRFRAPTTRRSPR